MDLAKVWEEILYLIESKMTRQGYDTCFAQSKLVSFDGTRMVIQVPSKFHRDWIREHHGEVLSEVIREVTKKDSIEIDFFVEPQEPQKKASRPAKEEKKEEEKGKYFRREITRGEFQRTLSLPDNVDDANAKASFKDGILTVTIPKTAKSKRKTIEIK